MKGQSLKGQSSKTSRAVLVQRWARRVLLGTAGASALYLYWRYDLVRLPEEGCSPLWSVAVGQGILVDLKADDVQRQDVVFYLDPAGDVRLGRVLAPRTGIEGPTGGAGLWVESDRASCPSVDSRDFGFLPLDRLVGRLLVVLPW